MSIYQIGREDDHYDRMRADRVEIKDGCAVLYDGENVLAAYAPDCWSVVIREDAIDPPEGFTIDEEDITERMQ